VVEMQQLKRVNYEKAVSPVIATILMVAITVVLSGVLYVWAANLAESNTDGTFEMYTFSAASAPGEMTSETNDNLIIVTMDQGKDLDWAKLDVKLSIAGAASVSCAGPGETTGACMILESDPEGNVWGIGEAVTIKENGVDLCNSDVCEVSVSVVNSRQGKTLDESSITAESIPLPPNPCYDKVLYNTQTHEVISKSQVEEGNTIWMLLPETSTNYVHPAYYSMALGHKVLDCSDDAYVEGWILTVLRDSNGGGSDDSGDSSSSTPEEIFSNYNYNVDNLGVRWVITDLTSTSGSGGELGLYVDRLTITEGVQYSGILEIDANEVPSIGDSFNNVVFNPVTALFSNGDVTITFTDENGNDLTRTITGVYSTADPDCGVGYSLYNVNSHGAEYYSYNDVVQNTAAYYQDGAAATTIPFLLLPDDNPRYADYNHPAYYHFGVHQVVDCTEDSAIVDSNGHRWVLADLSAYGGGGGGSHGGGGGDGGSGDGGSGDGGSDDDSSNANPTCDDSFLLYGGGANSHASYTQQQVKDGDAPNWNWLNPDQHPDYNHPAYYYSAGPQSNHDILDCTQDDSVNGWTLVEPQQN